MADDTRAVEQLEQTRREFRALLQSDRTPGQFPRSATMRFLMNSEGGNVAAGVLGSLLLRRLPLARNLIGMLPMKSMMRLLRRLPRG